MGDSQEENSDTAEKNCTEEVVALQDYEDKPVTKIGSEEKVHRSTESKCSIKSSKEEKIDGSKEKPEEKPAPKQETKDSDLEKPINDKEDKMETPNNMVTTEEKLGISNSAVSCTNEPREKIIRNQSDIFSLKVVPTTLQTSIFSVNGCPSRKVFRKQEPAGHLFHRSEEPPADKEAAPAGLRITKENYNDEKRPSSSYRNPLTGSGLSSNDEYKSKGTKRKDGNPLLGLGYDAEVTAVSSQHRIPPGGYSHKLW